MTTSINDALRINLELLHKLLDRASGTALHASAAMVTGERNLAIGTARNLEQLLPECDALYRMIILLHRSRAGEDLS